MIKSYFGDHGLLQVIENGTTDQYSVRVYKIFAEQRILGDSLDYLIAPTGAYRHFGTRQSMSLSTTHKSCKLRRPIILQQLAQSRSNFYEIPATMSGCKRIQNLAPADRSRWRI